MASLPRPCGSGLDLWIESVPVQHLDGIRQVLGGEVGIPHGHLQALVAAELLDRQDRDARLHEPAGERVTQAVRVEQGGDCETNAGKVNPGELPAEAP